MVAPSATATSISALEGDSIGELAQLIARTIGFEGRIEWDSSKPDGTMRKLTSVEKLHSLGWQHQVEIEDGVQRLFDWYRTH